MLRRFDDGPWRALAVGNDVCGIRSGGEADGALHCFADSNQYNPSWAELEGVGLGASYAVPIDGEVIGVGAGRLFDAYAWTRDGRIFHWDDRTAPHEVGRIEGVTEVAAGDDGHVAFARTRDGRVFVRGVRRQSDGTVPYWDSFGDEGGPWLEVEALRGQEVYVGAHHACALAPDHTVRCWGQRTGFLPGTEGSHYSEPPVEVPTFRGARRLIIGEWLTCAELANGRLRCVGAHLHDISNHAVDEERRQPLDVDFARILRSID